MTRFLGGPKSLIAESLLEALGANTPSGKAAGARPGSTGAVPHWDDEPRELRYRGTFVRIVRRPNQNYNIVTVLRAFEAAEWLARVDDTHPRI